MKQMRKIKILHDSEQFQMTQLEQSPHLHKSVHFKDALQHLHLP